MKIFSLVLIAVSLLINGCGNLLKSEYHPPAVNYPADWKTSLTADATVPFRWSDFQDPALENWLRQVMERNNNVALAVLRLYRAQLQAQRTGIDSSPSVKADLSADGRRMPDGDRLWSKSNAAQLSVSYEIDLWGKLARQRDAAQWESEATARDLATARLILLTRASENYWQLAFLNQRIAASEQSIAWAQDGLRLLRIRYQAGSAAKSDLAEAEQHVLAQQTSHETLLQQRIEARNAQSVLLGAPPGTVVAEPQQLPAGALPAISSDIPVQVLARRPDLSASELRLREALAQKDIRRVQYYPSFSLTGGLGTSSQQLLDFVRNPIATLGAGLSLPFIQWRQMDIDMKIASNDYHQRVLAFKQSLYNAMADVENVLSKRRSLLVQQQQLLHSLALARETERFSEIRYQEGAVAINLWLDAREKRRQAQLALDSNIYEQLQNLAQIYMAFGGDDDTEHF